MTTPRDIITAVCREFGVEYAHLVNARYRSPVLVEARDAAVYLMRTRTRASYPEIAAAMSAGTRSHASDVDRFNRALVRLDTDESFTRKVLDIDLRETAYELPSVRANADRDRFLAGRERIPPELDGDALRWAVAAETERFSAEVALEAP
jgi:hypothetical protein